MRSVKRWVLAGVGIALLAGGVIAAGNTVNGAARREALKSNDLTGIRKEALSLFPRGTRLENVAAHLAEIGFACEPMQRSLGDISGPALLCASNGRGYPDYPAVNLTVSTRNGLVSEIEVWNVMKRSDEGTMFGHLASDDAPEAVLSASNELRP